MKIYTGDCCIIKENQIKPHIKAIRMFGRMPLALSGIGNLDIKLRLTTSLFYFASKILPNIHLRKFNMSYM